MEPVGENSLHSSSIIQLFNQCNETYQFIQSLDMKEAIFLTQYAEIACKTVTIYFNHLIEREDQKSKQINLTNMISTGETEKTKDFNLTKEVRSFLCFFFFFRGLLLIIYFRFVLF